MYLSYIIDWHSGRPCRDTYSKANSQVIYCIYGMECGLSQETYAQTIFSHDDRFILGSDERTFQVVAWVRTPSGHLHIEVISSECSSEWGEFYYMAYQ